MRSALIRVSVFFLGVAALASAAGVRYRFSSAGRVPHTCQGCTVPLGVNAQHIFGYYEPTNSTVPGYIQTGTSFFTVLPFGGESGFVGAMNRHGVAVGGYCPAGSGCGGEVGAHGFMLKGGVYTNIDYPLAGASTIANGINDLGQIVGGYCPNGGGCPEGAFTRANHGFLDVNGVFTNLDYPGAQLTQALAINNSGIIVGAYDINFTGPHAFLYQNGAYKNIDYPGAGSTMPGAINNHGVAAGYYSDNSGLHGFTYKVQTGVFTTIDVPRSNRTSMTGISDQGEIVGLTTIGTTTENFKGIPVSGESGPANR